MFGALDRSSIRRRQTCVMIRMMMMMMRERDGNEITVVTCAFGWHAAIAIGMIKLTTMHRVESIECRATQHTDQQIGVDGRPQVVGVRQRELKGDVKRRVEANAVRVEETHRRDAVYQNDLSESEQINNKGE